MEQRKRIPSSILIFEKEGINLVPLLANGRGFDYAFYYEDEDEYYDSSTMGYLNETKYRSLAELKSRSFSDCVEEITKVKDEMYHRAYYDQTAPLAKEYESIRKALAAFDGLKSKKSLAKMVKEPYLKDYYGFMARNPDLFSHYRRYMDIRFNTILSATNDQIDNKGEKTLRAETYECNPKADFAEFAKGVEIGFSFLKSSAYYDSRNVIELIEEDYNAFVEKTRQLLKTHPKVGLVGQGKGHWPRFYPESRPIPIGSFTVDDYLTAKNGCIYWFE